jgi:hypothetical protein
MIHALQHLPLILRFILAVIDFDARFVLILVRRAT